MNRRVLLVWASALALTCAGTSLLVRPRTSVPHPVAAFATGWESTSPPLVVLAGGAAFNTLAFLPATTRGAQSTPQPATCMLRIHVDGFRNTRGNLGTILFTSPDGWPEDKQKAFRHGPAPIDSNARTAVAVWDLPAGDYGVAVIHDENSNARLDRNLIGIPKEGFGFANNPHVGLSAPPFHQAIVHVACPATEITVHLQYK